MFHVGFRQLGDFLVAFALLYLSACKSYTRIDDEVVITKCQYYST